ncbi:MAG: InlB B-repeat-containing protein [Acutalibacteraceae bacterium]|jgi:hypothetical protein
MRRSKRLLAVISTVLMLATMFALPYGAAADEATPTSDLGQVVGVVYEGETKTTVNGGDFIGRQFNNLDPVITLDKAAGNYAIVAEIKVHQDYGFTDGEWLQAALDDGSTVVMPSEGSNFNPGHLITTWLPKSGRENDEWMKVAIPLAGYAYSDIKTVQFNIYNHPERVAGSGLTADDRLHGASITYRNVYVVDMSRNANGTIKEEVATFGSPYDAEQTAVNNDGSHTVTSVPSTNIFYNGLTTDMTRDDLTLQFDIMYTSDNADFAPNKIVNGNVRLYDPNERNGQSSYLSGKISAKDTWHHISIPLSSYPAELTPSGINRIFGFNYNDASVGGVQTNPGFTTHVKNIKITYNDYDALQKTVAAAKSYTYAQDANAEVFEAKLAAAIAVLKDTDTTYADVTTALNELNDAKAALTNFRDVSYEVMRFSSQEYMKKVADVGRNQYWYNWNNADVPGTDLTFGSGENVLGANLYATMKVTLEKNAAYTGDITVPDIGTVMKNVQIRLRAADGDRPDGVSGECRSDSFTMNTLNKTVSEDGSKVVYEMECWLDDSTQNTGDRKDMNWSNVRSSIIFVNMNQDLRENGSASNTDIPVYCTLENVRIINKTLETVDAQIADVANAYVTPGKYTADSTAAYLALQADAQALMADPNATLMQKNALLAQVDAAKAQFVPIVAEYVQFGAPEAIKSWYNTGINGQHGMNQSIAVTSNTITGGEDFSKLALRIEYRVTRDDGVADCSKTMVNGNLKLNSFQKNGTFSNSSFKSGEWGAVYIPLSDFGITAETDLSAINTFALFQYNDLRGLTSNPGATFELRNVAIVDTTNTADVAALAEAFKPLTGEYTAASLAAYQAVYDQWYPVYQFVDLSQAEDAIAAMTAAKALLAPVGRDVMTFSAWNKTYDSNARGFYADWRTADQGTVDISKRNLENLVVCFDLSVSAKEGYTLPDTLTRSGGMRLAIRKWSDREDPDGKERSIEFSQPFTTLDTSKVNSYEIPLLSANGSTNEDGLVRDILMWVNFNELNEDANHFVFTIANARVIDTTKEKMAAALEEAATATGVYVEGAALTAYRQAQADALVVLAKEDPTYAELEAAQNAIDTAKAALTAVGHVVKVFEGLNGNSGTGKGYIERSWSNDAVSDLSGYKADNLVMRFNLNLHDENGTTEIPEGVTTVDTRSSYVELRNADNEVTRVLAEKTWPIGDNAIEVSLVNYASLSNLKDARVFGYAKEDGNGATKKSYQFTISNARIVDTTAEKNFGKLNVVGNGYVELTGGLLSGTEDTLVAHPADGYTLAGWTINGQWTTEANPTATADGKQNATAYFVKDDEAVVFFYGKSNNYFDMQVIKADDAATALSNVKAPVIYGYTFSAWDVDADALAIAINEGTTATVTASYVQDAASDNFTVTLVGDMTAKLKGATVDTTSFTAKFDDRVTVTATGAGFSYWKLDGMVVGFDTTYTFYVSGDNTIEAVYGGSEATADEIQVSMKKGYTTVLDNGKLTFTAIGQIYVPAAATIDEYGIVFAPNTAKLDAVRTGGFAAGVDGKDYVRVASSSTTANRQFMVGLRNVTSGKNRYAIAYVIVDGTAYFSANTLGGAIVADATF